MTILAEFLAARMRVQTGCHHQPVTLMFQVGDPGRHTKFSVSFRDGWAVIQEPPSATADYRIECTESELGDVLEGRKEILGPFWEAHLPFDFFWAPSLYAFFFPNHPYHALSPALTALYTESRFYPTTTPFPQGYRLYRLARELSLNMTLEIGLAYGGSALFLAAAHRDKGAGHHFALDPFQTSLYQNQALDFVKDAGLTNHVTCLQVKAVDALKGFARAQLQFDLIYIDGDHGVRAVLEDFLRANRCLRNGGVLAFDDSHFPSGARVLRVIETHFPYRMLDEHCSDRLKVLRKEGNTEGPLAVRLAASAPGGMVSDIRSVFRSLRARGWRLPRRT